MLDPIKKAFREQRNNAKRRGVNWLITFDQWIKWWEKQLGPNWFEKRGKNSGQYVMARKRDKGAYSLGNVECITVTKNGRDQWRNGRSGPAMGPKKLTPKQVLEIYYSTDTVPNIGRKYKVRAGNVEKIKRHQIWKHITDGLDPAPYVPGKSTSSPP